MSGSAKSPEDFSSPWMPLRIRITLNDAGKATVREVPYNEPAGHDIYELTTVISHILDTKPSAPAYGSVVAHVKVPERYFDIHSATGDHKGKGSSSDGDGKKWYLMSDFRITQTYPCEAVRFPYWKKPCIVFYTRTTSLKECPPVPLVNPLDERVFTQQTVLNHSRLTSLPKTVIPKAGDIVAIDAEYVSLSEEETVTELDGSQQVLVPSHMSVARVSCICGVKGAHFREPIIDDLVRGYEPVVNYLTRYSGIMPGDLDPEVSKKKLTTLKTVIMKLSYMISIGCVFVGHGLSNDMKVIGLTIPQNQIIDTVELFHLERQRWVSLRFLGSYLLNEEIQTGNHCSVEDALMVKK